MDSDGGAKWFGGALVILAILLLSAASTPAAAHPVNNTTCNTTNNTTVDVLRDRLAEKRERIDDLKRKIITLQSRTEKMENTIATLRSDQGSQWPSWMVSQMRRLGAWDPNRQQPAWYVVRNDIILYWVGPGNGEHSLNGYNAWDTLLTFKKAGTKNITLPYAHAGVDRTLNVTVGFESMGALPKIKQRLRQANSPRTWAGAMQYTNAKRHQAERVETRTYALVGGGFVIALVVGMFINRGAEGWLDTRLRNWRVIKDEAAWGSDSAFDRLMERIRQ